MSSDPPDLGKGIFGYRKSAVNQIIADRDIMLRQAEGRVRAAEARVAELESELSSFRDQNTRMDEQLEQLRTQLDMVLKRAESGFPGKAETAGSALASGAADHEEGFGYIPPAEEADTAEELTSPPETYGWATPAGADEEGAAAPPAPEIAAEPSGQAAEWELPTWARAEAPTGQPGAAGAAARPEEPMPGEPMPEHRDLAPAESATPAWWETQVAEAQAAAEGSTLPPHEPAPVPEPHWPATAAPQDWGPGPSDQDWTQPAQEHGWTQTPQDQDWAQPPQEEGWPPSVPPPSAPPPPPPPPHPLAGPRQAPAEPPARPDDATTRFLTEELAGILAAAEESAARIVERARASTQRQIMESNRLWREVQSEVARFASWRDQVEPVIRQVQSKVDSARGLVEDVPERIREALAPMADAISSIDADMAELSTALTPPLLLTPSGFEGEGQDLPSEAPETSLDYGSDEGQTEDEAYRGGDRPGPFGAEAG